MKLDGSSTESRDHPPAGTLMRGRYELGEALGEGGFFTVTQARDVTTGRPVAVKALKTEFRADPEFVARLRAEAEASLRLTHPGIAQVYEIWDEGGILYLATEWVRGINLKDRMRRLAPFPLAVAIDIAAAVAEIVAAAAEEGCVHGDLRPENVIITPEGHVKVTDFGIGRAAAASSRVQVAALLQAARYYPPEATQGHAPTPTGDVYSLGILLYEMLAGQVPFDGETPFAIAVKHLHDAPPPLRRQNPGVPKGVEAVVHKCLQKDPAARYPTVVSLLADLRTVREALRFGRPLETPPTGATTRRRDGETGKRRDGETVTTENRTPDQRPAGRVSPQPLAASGEQGAASTTRGARKPRSNDEEDTAGEPATRTLVLGFLLAVLVLVGGFAFMGWVFRAPRDVLVPPVMQLTQADAEARVKAAGLKLIVDRFEHDERYPEGTVIRALPPAGSSVKEGRAVRVWISRGPAPIEVPDVTGMDLKRARGEIRGASLVVGRIADEYNETIAKGEVISQSPSGGQPVPRRTSVSLVVSKGAEPPPPEPKPFIPEGDPNTPIRDRLFDVSFEVPAGPDQQEVRIEVTDADGPHEVVNQTHRPGENVQYEIPARGRKGGVIIRVYLDGRLYRQSVK